MAVSRPRHSTKFWRNPTPKMLASADTSHIPNLWPRKPIRRGLTSGKLRWMRKIPKSRYIPHLGGPSVTIPITLSSDISSITRGYPVIILKTLNWPSDLSKPTFPSPKLITTSTKADARFPSTFPTPLDGRCIIKYTRSITSYEGGEKPSSPHHTVRVFSIFETR